MNRIELLSSNRKLNNYFHYLFSKPMEKLIEQIKDIPLTMEAVFDYDLEREFDLISPYLTKDDSSLLKSDFNSFLDKGKFLVLNTFAGGILFLKNPEPIKEIGLEYESNLNSIIASITYLSEERDFENVKRKPGVGQIESTTWHNEIIFSNFSNYPQNIKIALLIVLGKIVKRICEYGRLNIAYMKIENSFKINLRIDGEFHSQIDVLIES